ncbi:hypothetical protein GCM10010402_39080 [Actinomadura luteofluorescens]
MPTAAMDAPSTEGLHISPPPERVDDHDPHHPELPDYWSAELYEQCPAEEVGTAHDTGKCEEMASTERRDAVGPSRRDGRRPPRRADQPKRPVM